ncbi:hypothetical protein [Methylorubrum aminovorans]|nr:MULTISPECIES: hypothetical protein [unclassified Methylobacterium]
MPTGPKGQKRLADAIDNAVKVMWIATEEEPEDYGPAEAEYERLIGPLRDKPPPHAG